MSNVKVVSTNQRYTTQVEARTHTWIADEPEESGGQDLGPTPTEQLIGAIGACVVITAQMYASRKEWPLEKIEIALEHRMVDAKDCPECSSTTGKVMEVAIAVTLSGPLSAEQRERIFEIAGRCPVKRALEGEIKFRSSLK